MRNFVTLIAFMVPMAASTKHGGTSGKVVTIHKAKATVIHTTAPKVTAPKAKVHASGTKSGPLHAANQPSITTMIYER